MADQFTYVSVVTNAATSDGGGTYGVVQFLNTDWIPAGAGGTFTGPYMNTSERSNYFFTSGNSFAQSTHVHGALALTNLSGTSASDGLSLAVPAGGAVSLNDVLDPSADKVFNMGTRALQFQYAGGGTFSTNATRQAMFEIDVVGAITDGADVVHIHQSVGNASVDLLHLQAASTGVTLLRLDAAASIVAEVNQPIKWTGGSVPMILGTSQSNSVQYLNANFLQGRASSYFQSAGAYLTTAQPPGAYLTTAAATNVTTNNMATAERSNYFFTSNNTFANSTHTHGALALTNVSATSASNGLSLSVAAPGAAQAFPQYWCVPPWAGANGVLISNLSATGLTRRPIFLPFQVEGALTADEIHWMMSRAATGVNSFTMNIGIYTYSNSTKINLVGSTQNVFVNSDTGSQNGVRLFEANMGTGLSQLTPGQYVLALAFSANGDSTSAFNYSLIGGATANPPGETKVLAGSNSYATYTSHQAMLFFGRYTATSAVIPATVGLAEVSAQAGASIPLYFTLGNHV